MGLEGYGRSALLRHAYGQIWNLLAGYSFSALVDVDSMPDTLDFEGPGSMVYVMQPQVRYTLPLDTAKKHTLAFSLERGTSDILTQVPTTQVTVTPTSPWPDGVIRYRYEGARGHFQAGAVFRSVGGYVGDTAQRHTFAWGVSLAGAAHVGERDNFLYQLNAGKGMGRYVEDVQGLAPDVGIDRHGHLAALPLCSGFLGYQHYWSETLRSTLTYGYLKVDSKEYRFTTDFYRSDYGAVNLIWNPRGTSFNFGVEYLYGDQVLRTGRSGHANRVQISIQYDLLKLK